jgi:hypothetical protein
VSEVLAVEVFGCVCLGGGDVAQLIVHQLQLGNSSRVCLTVFGHYRWVWVQVLGGGGRGAAVSRGVVGQTRGGGGMPCRVQLPVHLHHTHDRAQHSPRGATPWWCSWWGGGGGDRENVASSLAP